MLTGNPAFHTLTIDAKNAFNCVRRDAMYEEVKSHFPEFVPLFEVAYRHPSKLHVIGAPGQTILSAW